MAKKKSSKRYTDVKRRITATPGRTDDRRAYMPENTPENRLAGRVGGQPWSPGQEYLGDTGRTRSDYERMQDRAIAKIGRSKAALRNKTLSKAGKSAKNPAARAAQAQHRGMTGADVSTSNPPDWY